VEKVERQDLGASVAQALKQLIFRGSLGPGDRLVETELAARFGTSRGPVRDALGELELSGLVEQRPGRGCLIRQLSKVDVEEIYSLRTVLESLAVRRLIASIHDPGRGLPDLLSALTIAHKGGDRFAIAISDMALHRAIVVNSQHHRVAESWERLADQTMLLMVELTSLDPIVQGPAGEHHRIVEAIAASDVHGAVNAITRHLEVAQSTILGHLSAR
jgi:GntR family transcriptional regulator, gluconate operon transcriptional repressor